MELPAQLRAEHQLTEAASELQQSLHRARNIDAMSALGYVLYRTGDLDGALMQYETVLRFQQIVTPPREFPEAYLFRGAIRAGRQEFSQAINDYTRSIEIYNRQITSLNAQAEISDSTGLKQKAEIERRHERDLQKQLRMAVDLKTNAEKQMQRYCFMATSESTQALKSGSPLPESNLVT